MSKLNAGDSVRIIGLEPSIPILASVSAIGSVNQISGTTALVDVYRGHPYQLERYPVLLLRADVDLTKRELEAVDFIHRGERRIRNVAFAILGWS